MEKRASAHLTVWVVNFRATNDKSEEMDVGPFTFTTETKARDFVQRVVAEEMKRRIQVLDDWQQREVMKESQGAEPTLEEMVERYFDIVDESGESSLVWSIDFDIVDLGDVQDARRVFDFV